MVGTLKLCCVMHVEVFHVFLMIWLSVPLVIKTYYYKLIHAHVCGEGFIIFLGDRWAVQSIQ